MSDSFKLPASSYDELIKIIKAYASGKGGQSFSLDVLSQTTGISTTTISRNNAFLMEMELVTPGRAKTATEACTKLGRAYTHNVPEDAINIWRELIDNNEFLSRMISAVKIRNGMDRANFLNHIIYSSGLNSTNEAKTGAGSIIEILKFSGFVEEQDGKILSVFSEKSKTTNIQPSDETHLHEECSIPVQKHANIKQSKNVSIIINININCSMDNLDLLPDKIRKLTEELG